MEVTKGGGWILSTWSDGKIRAFYPETGRLKFIIPEAHSEAVTALAACHDDGERDDPSPWRVVSVGADDRVRVWNIGGRFIRWFVLIYLIRLLYIYVYVETYRLSYI